MAYSYNYMEGYHEIGPMDFSQQLSPWMKDFENLKILHTPY